MRHSPFLTFAALLATLPVGCADDMQLSAETADDSVRFELVIENLDVTAVTFDVTCEDDVELTGEFNVNEGLDPQVWSVIMDLPVGECSVTLTAFEEGEPICSGSSDFTVIEDETVQVGVVLTCEVDSADSPSGGVDAGGSL
jgi:hypothetical protein